MAEVDNDDAKTLTENLYKQNIEISGKNKTLSLLSKLYEISILSLAPKDLALHISQTIQTSLNLELVGLWLQDESSGRLLPLAFAESERVVQAQNQFKTFFDKL